MIWKTLQLSGGACIPRNPSDKSCCKSENPFVLQLITPVFICFVCLDDGILGFLKVGILIWGLLFHYKHTYSMNTGMVLRNTMVMSLEFNWIHMDLANDIYKQPQRFNLHKLDILMIFKTEEFSVVGTSIFYYPVVLRSISYCIMYALHTCSITQLCLTLCNPMDCSSPSSSVHEIFQARILVHVVIPSFRGSYQCRAWTKSPTSAGKFFTTESPRKHILFCVFNPISY